MRAIKNGVLLDLTHPKQKELKGAKIEPAKVSALGKNN